MDYQQTIDYLFTRLPMFSRVGPAAFKKDLTNTLALCGRLGDPHKKFRTVHVAGTNGKGSVSHMLAAILQEAGYRTGLYTSPHLKDFRERIRINGSMISEQEVIGFTESVRPYIEEIEPSFFEITVAMAFDHFARHEVDIAVVEVGLGGRLDSTNVITPELSIITSIGYDHMNMLGNTIEAIAFEKAGIIKPGIPVVIGELPPEAMDVMRKSAGEKEAGLYPATETWQAANWEWTDHELVIEVSESHHTDHQKYQLDLPGIYQVKNLLTVLESVRILRERGWNIPDQSAKRALRSVKKMTGLEGRWEIIHRRPMVVLEVAHNPDGVLQMAEQIELCTYRRLHLVLGLVNDKELEPIFSVLPGHAAYYFSQAHIPRALEADSLQQQAMAFGLYGEAFDSVNEALNTALSRSTPEDLLIVCGSIFLVAELEKEKIRFQ